MYINTENNAIKLSLFMRTAECKLLDWRRNKGILEELDVKFFENRI